MGPIRHVSFHFGRGLQAAFYQKAFTNSGEKDFPFSLAILQGGSVLPAMATAPPSATNGFRETFLLLPSFPDSDYRDQDRDALKRCLCGPLCVCVCVEGVGGST